MDPAQLENALSGHDLVAAVEMSIPDAKRTVERCLAAAIPAVLGGDDCCETGGCAPKAQVLVREEDVAKVRQLLEKEWLEAAAREGTLTPEYLEKLRVEVAPDGDPPCPACGTAAPLRKGACSDCGLQLE